MCFPPNADLFEYQTLAANIIPLVFSCLKSRYKLKRCNRKPEMSVICNVFGNNKNSIKIIIIQNPNLMLFVFVILVYLHSKCIC